ncbi:general stress protein [Microbacterium sp. No. 7]|uniref:general stress protein n=1 Tax=Microbacterium sp. No. 7 TaxID=1714373 RepID=UPI0006CFB05C|nr:general stress protein [Microbacterium sp. No. 7]ALJ19953.1 hypothetical protein AOA12_08545 [Microbacterium sp. No. 7]
MSMMGGIPREQGEKIAEFASYEAAQKAVTQLIEADVPAKDIQIIGRGLRSVETVTGRLGYAAAARQGAVNGILFGLLFSAIFVLGTPDAAIQVFAGVMLVGIALGMLMSLLMYAIVRRRRSYTSITQIVADSYELHVLEGSIHRAREAVGTRAATPPPAVDLSTLPPPQYGERILPGETPSSPRAGEASPGAPEPPSAAEPPRYGERVDPAAPSGDDPQR